MEKSDGGATSPLQHGIMYVLLVCVVWLYQEMINKITGRQKMAEFTKEETELYMSLLDE